MSQIRVDILTNSDGTGSPSFPNGGPPAPGLIGTPDIEVGNIDASGSYKISGEDVLDSTTLGIGVIQSSLETVGTITAGVWNATTIDPSYGGTGQTSYTKGQILAADTTTTLSKIDVGTDGQVLTADSSSPSGIKWSDSTGGGGGGGDITELPLISNTSLNVIYTGTLSFMQMGAISQKNESNFIVAYSGYDTPSNVIRLWSQEFTVDSNGTVTTQSPVSTTNSSGTSMSTTIIGETFPGRISCIGRHYYSGSSYYVLHWWAHIPSDRTRLGLGSTTNIGVVVYSDYASNMMHPQTGNPFATGSGGLTWHIGYSNSSYGGYTNWSSSDSSMSFNSGTTLNSYSSTSGCTDAKSHWSQITNRCGIGYDHRDGSSGYYITEYYDSTYSGLGYEQSLFGTNGYGNRLCGWKSADDTKAVYYSPYTGYAITTNGRGTIIENPYTFNIFFDSNNLMYGSGSGNSNFCIKPGIFATSDENGAYVIWKLVFDGNKARGEIKGRLSGFVPSAKIYGSGSIAKVRFAGANYEFLVVASQNGVIVYDASSLDIANM